MTHALVPNMNLVNGSSSVGGHKSVLLSYALITSLKCRMPKIDEIPPHNKPLSHFFSEFYFFRIRIDFWQLRLDVDVDKWCFQADRPEGDVYNVKEMLRRRGWHKLSWQIDIHSQSSSNILGHVLYCWNIFYRTMARDRAWQMHPLWKKAPYRDCFIQSRTIVWILTFCKSMAKTQMVGKEVESSYCCLRQKE